LLIIVRKIILPDNNMQSDQGKRICTQRIIEPLGLHATWLDVAEVPKDRLVASYHVRSGRFSREPSIAWPDYGIVHAGIQDINVENMAEVLRVNTIVPALWFAALMPVLKGSRPCRCAIFSARAGSISDNRAGGWYRYRVSKAA